MDGWGAKYRAVRSGVVRIRLLISRWRRGKIWNSTMSMVAEPEGYTDTMYVGVPDGPAHDGFGLRRWMVWPSRFGPSTRMVRPTSLSLLNSATVDSAL